MNSCQECACFDACAMKTSSSQNSCSHIFPYCEDCLYSDMEPEEGTEYGHLVCKRTDAVIQVNPTASCPHGELKKGKNAGKND